MGHQTRDQSKPLRNISSLYFGAFVFYDSALRPSAKYSIILQKAEYESIIKKKSKQCCELTFSNIPQHSKEKVDLNLN